MIAITSQLLESINNVCFLLPRCRSIFRFGCVSLPHTYLVDVFFARFRKTRKKTKRNERTKEKTLNCFAIESERMKMNIWLLLDSLTPPASTVYRYRFRQSLSSGARHSKKLFFFRFVMTLVFFGILFLLSLVVGHLWFGQMLRKHSLHHDQIHRLHALQFQFVCGL